MTKTLLSLVIALMLVYVNITQLDILAQENNRLKIVVTFPFMVEDIKSMLCHGDEVFSITPPGLDPHEYQLTPRDVELLTKADLIISTAHTPFEAKIKELTLVKEIKAELIEVPSIPGLAFLKNPSTGIVNYHGMLFHGDNYVTFIRYVANALSNLRPQCSNIYNNKAEELIQSVKEISLSKPLRGFKAVVDSPVLQYLVVWLGAEVEHIVMVEHDVPIPPQDIDKVRETLQRSGENMVIILTEDSILRNILGELAQEFGVRTIVVPNPIASTNSISAYLKNAIVAIFNTSTTTTYISTHGSGKSIDLSITILVLTLVSIAILAILRARR